MSRSELKPILKKCFPVVSCVNAPHRFRLVDVLRAGKDKWVRAVGWWRFNALYAALNLLFGTLLPARTFARSKRRV